MAAPRARQQSVVIDLVSSDDEEGGVDLLRPRQNQQPPQPQPPQDPRSQRPPSPFGLPLDDAAAAAAAADNNNGLNDYAWGVPGAFQIPVAPRMRSPLQEAPRVRGGEYITIDGEEIFLPDSPEPQAQNSNDSNQNPRPQANFDEDFAFMLDEQSFTVDTCLQRVLAIFPDISHEHVRKLYIDYDADEALQSLSGSSRFENIVEKLVSGEEYPKEERSKPKKKRKRENEEDEASTKRWEGPARDTAPVYCKGATSAIIKADFPDVSQSMISNLLATHKHLYQTYVAVANERDTADGNKKWRGKPARMPQSPEDLARNTGYEPLLDELLAARKRVNEIRAERVADRARKQVEEQNLQQAIAAGETAECQACFEDLPMNRQIHCNGDTAHFTCFECAETYIKSEVGESRCRVLCTAGCGAGFAHAQLQLLSNKQLLEKLAQLQQEKDIREAGLDNLEECPFCEYKAIMPPVEEDFEFRCANPDCEQVSCRRCKAISHIPRTCEENAKDNKLNTRHKIEEAMTAAMIRSCNKCKKQFIKDFGCNKMTCPSCGNLQCYVCSESLKDYNHFDQGPGGPNRGGSKNCPLYDNVEERHEREVKAAEEAARAQAIEDNPDVSADDLQIKVSDAVSKATEDRIRRAGGVGGGPQPGFGGLFRMPLHRRRARVPYDADEDEGFDDDEEVALNDRLALNERLNGVQHAARLPRIARVAERYRRMNLQEGVRVPAVHRPLPQPPRMQPLFPMYEFEGLDVQPQPQQREVQAQAPFAGRAGHHPGMPMFPNIGNHFPPNRYAQAPRVEVMDAQQHPLNQAAQQAAATAAQLQALQAMARNAEMQAQRQQHHHHQHIHAPMGPLIDFGQPAPAALPAQHVANGFNNDFNNLFQPFGHLQGQMNEFEEQMRRFHGGRDGPL